MINQFEKYNMQLHYFTIFGFPTETQQEIKNTENFLLKHIKRHDFFTCTP
jgi:hypothetical protein